MNNTMRIDQMLNGAGPSEGDSGSPAGLPAAIRSPAPERPAPTSTSPTFVHKYSNSEASTASFAISTNTHNSPSHSRNPSYSTTYSINTNPETPPSAHSITGQFPSYCSDNNFDSRSNKMADMAEPADEHSKRVAAQDIDDEEDGSPPLSRPAPSRFATHRAIDLTSDDRTHSPTDAVMPMKRRLPAVIAAAAETSSSARQVDAASSTKLGSPPHIESSPSSSSRDVAVVAASSIQLGSLPPIKSSRSTSHQRASSSSSSSRDVTAVVTQFNSPDADHDQDQVRVQAAPPAPNLPYIAPLNSNSPLRLDEVLIQSAVPRLFQTVDILMHECDFTLPKSCKFMEDCLMTRGVNPDDVPWRKSMSHIFGRNKNCTRSIPGHVWMWVCRKHYQRARYRNAHEFNKKLIRMVELQVLRLEAWSNYNKDRGMPQEGVVVSWTLGVRRREKLRLEENRKRKSMSDDEEENEEDEDLSALATDGALVPQWLLDKTGDGKSTAEIQEIVARICRELEDSTLVAFPDIEILPKITGERAKPSHNRSRPAPPSARKRQPESARRDDPSCESRDKRQRRPDDNYAAEPGLRPVHPAHLPFRPHPGNAAHYENERHGYGSQPAPLPGAWQPRFGDPPRGPYPEARAGPSHQRAFSLDTNAYSQPMPYQGYPEPAGGYAGYGQAPVHAGRDYMRDPSYITANLGQNGYWDADYYARQQQQQSQPQQATYPQNDYLRPQAIAGGPPPVSAAKHSRNLSTPPRLRPPMAGHPNDGYDSGGMQPRYDSYLTAQAAGPSAPTANMYAQPAARYPSPYNGLPVSSVPSLPTTHAGGGEGGSIPRTTEYYLPGSTRLPTHGGASASPPAPAPGGGAEGFEPAYGPARR